MWPPIKFYIIISRTVPKWLNITLILFIAHIQIWMPEEISVYVECKELLDFLRSLPFLAPKYNFIEIVLKSSCDRVEYSEIRHKRLAGVWKLGNICTHRSRNMLYVYNLNKIPSSSRKTESSYSYSVYDTSHGDLIMRLAIKQKYRNDDVYTHIWSPRTLCLCD